MFVKNNFLVNSVVQFLIHVYRNADLKQVFRIMWPSCGLQLASPDKHCVHGQQNEFRCLHANTPLQSLSAHGLQSTLCAHTATIARPTTQAGSNFSSYISPRTCHCTAHTQMFCAPSTKLKLRTSVQPTCYLTYSHLLHASKTSQCAPPNFWILTVCALWVYCTHTSSTSIGLH